MIEIKNERPKLEESVLQEVEKQLGFQLPLNYRRFLLEHNGGHPVLDAFPIEENPSDTHGLIHYFLCICAGDAYHLPLWIKRYQGRLLPNLLPIACDPGGNLICLAVTGFDAGTLYFWEHELETTPPSYNNLYYIADNFSTFLSSLSQLN